MIKTRRKEETAEGEVKGQEAGESDKGHLGSMLKHTAKRRSESTKE